jgi:hypothetical protein
VRKIKSYFFISLDGVVESPDKWHFRYLEFRRREHDRQGGASGVEQELLPPVSP